MTLTLPRAGTNPGRAPRAQEVPVDTTGQAVAQLGGALMQLAEDRDDRQVKRAQVDLTRDMNDLRLEIEQIGDPDEADAAFTAGVTALRGRYLGDGRNEEGVVPRRRREDFGLTFDSLANAQAFAIGKRNLALRQSERLATFDQYMFQAARMAAGADAGTRAELARAADSQIEGLLASGIIDAERAERMRQDVRGDLDGPAALAALNDDPAGFLERLDAGEFIALAPETQVRMRATATDALRKAAEKAQKDADKAAKEHRDALRADLDRIASLGDTSRLGPEDRALLEDPAVAELAKGDEKLSLARRRAQARVSLDEDETLYTALPPADLDRAIAIERERTVRHPFEEERLALLEELRDKQQKELAEDPLSHVAAAGFSPPPLPLDQGDAAFAAGLAARRRHSDWLQEQGWTTAPAILNVEERKAVKAQMEAETDPAQRRMLVEGFARQLGKDAERVLLQATGDRVVAHAATLLRWGAPRDTVDDVLTAQKRLKDGTATRPSPAAFRSAFANVTAGMFHNQPELEARLMATAEALYVEANPTGDTSDIDTDALKTAVSRAFGGSDEGVGGLATIDPPGARNKHNLPLPPGVSADAVEAALSGLYHRYTGDVAPRETRDPVTFDVIRHPADLAPLREISLNNAAPDFGGVDPDALLRDARIVPIWEGGQPTDRYTFVRNVGGQDIALTDERGARYEFSLRRLVRGGER